MSKLPRLYLTILTLSLLLTPFISRSDTNCCYHECNIGDPNKCDGGKVMQCKASCPTDTDPYNDWCEVEDCTAEGKNCVGGVCTGTANLCADGSGYNTCSTFSGAPWFCNNSGTLIEKCSSCGCSGTWACSVAGTFCCDNLCNNICSKPGCTVEKDPDCACVNNNGCCGVGCNSGNDNDCAPVCTPDGCNANCPSSCTVAQDPDCGCQNSNSCCGISCMISNDNDCAAVDTMAPQVATFNVTKTTGASINWATTDTGGSHLNRVEFWRAPDISGSPGTWSEIVTLRKNITGNLDTKSGTDLDGPAPGIYWYGTHVVDNAGNMGTEPSPVKIDLSGACTENWTCASWSACTDGVKTRACTDSNACGTIFSKPEEQNFCLSISIKRPNDNSTVNQNASTQFLMNASGGKTPYIYEWRSDKAGIFSTNFYENEDTISWVLGQHNITATVTDADSNTASKSITINMVSASTLNAQFYMNEKYSQSETLWYYGNYTGGTGPYTFEWKSDKKGVFGTNQNGSTTLSTWPLGMHHITLTVKDSLANASIAEKDIQIVDFAIINSNPGTGMEFEQMFDTYFTGNVSGGQSPYEFTWKSDKDGTLKIINSGTNNATFIKDNLSLGYHNITLNVKDANGLIDSKTALIKIKPLTPITVTITSPTNGATFNQGDIINFSETHAGGVYPSIYEWKSNKNGILSTTSSFTINNNLLTTGNHTLTLTVKDSKGNSGQVTINFTINPPAPLTATINSPTGGSSFKASDQLVTLDGSASGGVQPYTYSWSSNKNGALGTNKKLGLTNLNIGNHIITFTIKDSLGTTDAKTVNINILANCSINNTKNMSKYSAKEVFMIPDTNWRSVLALLPVTTWREGNNIKKYPSLIYHQETSTFDADSSIHFLQMYLPDHLTTVETIPADLNNLFIAAQPTGAGISVSNINNTASTSYFSYWSSFNTLVVSDYDNYKAGLLASVLASHQNAPIIFVKGSNLASYQSIINGKNIYVVGDLDTTTQNYIDNNSACQVKYTIDEMQKWYAADTGSDKLILVNPKDPTIVISGNFKPEKSGTTTKSFASMSLTAPFLASAREEVIEFSEQTDPGNNSTCVVNAAIKPSIDATDTITANAINNLFLSQRPNYLTIISAPRAIPDSDYDYCYNGWQIRKSADWRYGSVSNQVKENLKTGRIYGINTSDASTYINTSLFYDDIFNNLYLPGEYTSISIGHSFREDTLTATTSSLGMRNAGYNAECYIDQTYPGCVRNITPPINLFEHRQYITYHDHGSPTGWNGSLTNKTIPWLSIPYVYSDACLTNSFWKGFSGTFGINMLRRGAIAHYGNVGVAYLSWDGINAAKTLFWPSTRISSGELMSNLLYAEAPLFQAYPYTIYNSDYTILLGDPVLIPKVKQLTW